MRKARFTEEQMVAVILEADRELALGVLLIGGGCERQSLYCGAPVASESLRARKVAGAARYLGPQMRRTRSRGASWVSVTWYQSKPRAKSRVGTHFGRDGGVRGETILCDPVRNSGDAFVVGIIGRVDKRLIGFDFVQ